MTVLRLFCLLTALPVFSSVADGQEARVPVVNLRVVNATDSGTLTSITGVHARRDGRVLVNDASGRQLVLFEPHLRSYKRIAGADSGVGVAYGTEAGALLPFVGDSTAFVDRAAHALVIIDARGEVGRTFAVPKTWDIYLLADSLGGQAGFDENGRLYYRGAPPFRLPQRAGTRAETTYVVIDSAPIVRADFEARRVDTVARVRIPEQKHRLIRIGDGASLYPIVNPLPESDDWAFFPDGSIAIVRGHDYHIDWVLPDGAKRSTSKMPFDWLRVTDVEKHRIVDSVQRLIDSAFAARVARSVQAAGGRETPASVRSRLPQPEVLAPTELPDYYPPLYGVGLMRVDPMGRLWILPRTSARATGGLLYDVVDRSGEIVERAQLPPGRKLIGFGSDGSVYLAKPHGNGAILEEARIDRGVEQWSPLK